MHSLSPKARGLIEVGLVCTGDPAALAIWRGWSERHPFRRSEDPASQAAERLPEPVATAIVTGLNNMTAAISERLDEDEALSREEAISLENDLAYIAEIESEVKGDLRAAGELAD